MPFDRCDALAAHCTQWRGCLTIENTYPFRISDMSLVIVAVLIIAFVRGFLNMIDQ